MPNRSSKRGQGPKDFNQIAWEVVQKAIGEMPKEEPPDPSKNAAAVTLGRPAPLQVFRHTIGRMWVSTILLAALLVIVSACARPIREMPIPPPQLQGQQAK